MAADWDKDRKQKKAWGTNSLLVLTNVLLVLILIGIVILIFLHWHPWTYGSYGYGKTLAAPGSSVVHTDRPGNSGGIVAGPGTTIINTCCDEYSGDCPTCPDCPGDDPVCDPYTGTVYSSLDEAYAAGVTYAIPGPCPDDDEVCVPETGETYPSSTAAEAAGYTYYTTGPCPEDEEVCDPYTGTTYSSRDAAYAAGVTAPTTGPCPEPDQPDDYCNDTDGGIDYYYPGSVWTGSDPTPQEDDCDQGSLIEYYCDGNVVERELYNCPYGCENNRCLPEPECEETDNGRDAMNYGTLTHAGETYTDSCSDEYHVFEYYCQGNSFTTDTITCPYRCQNGECTDNYAVQ